VCAGCTVLCYEVVCCVYGDTIQMQLVVVVFCAGCTVLSCVLICCVYGDTIKMEMVILCVLVALYCVTR